MWVVLDTDVIVAALRSPQGASAAILRGLDEGRGTLLLSMPLALEYEAVCQLAEHRLVTGLTTDDVEVFVNSLTQWPSPLRHTSGGGPLCAAMPMNGSGNRSERQCR